MKKLILLALLAIFIGWYFGPAIDSCFAASVILSWDKPDDERVAGYNIYHGIKGSDFKVTPTYLIPSADITSQIIEPLEEGTEYGFTSTSTDGLGNESDFATTIFYKTGVTVPQEEPVEVPTEIPLPVPWNSQTFKLDGFLTLTPIEP